MLFLRILFAYCLSGLRSACRALANVHVFHWGWPEGGQREMRPLADGAAVWRDYLEIVARIDDGQERWALLEFVRGGEVAQFLEDAVTLASWLDALAAAGAPG